MITYTHGDIGYSNEKYTISYKELKNLHTDICNYSDEEFLTKLPEAAHLACIICWFKEIPVDICLCDKGIVHELVHMIHNCELNEQELKSLRLQFKTELKLD